MSRNILRIPVSTCAGGSGLKSRALATFSRLLLAAAAAAVGMVGAACAQERIVLQLRWDNEFQFAGYYAALWQGYYRDAGFDVEIRSVFRPDGSFRIVTDEVAEGRATFGVSGSDILTAYSRGAPLVVVAPFLQHSGNALYALSSTRLTRPNDLVGLRIARKAGDVVDNEVIAMLRAEGINPDRLDFRPYRPPGLEDLLSRLVDVIPGRSLSTPWLAQQAGVELNVVRPLSYGIDFYGDTLFTHRDIADRDPALVERFRIASSKGWAYAFEHVDEIAERIGKELPRTVPLGDALEYNKFQADEVKALAVYPVIELGHMNPDRWRRMYDVLKTEGAVSRPFRAESFIFDYEDITLEARGRYLQLAGAALVSLLVAGMLMLFWNRALRYEVAARTRDLRRSEERFALAEAGSNEVIWDWELATGRTYCSPRFGELFGHDPTDMGDRIENWQKLVHPQDLPAVQDALEAHLAGRTPRYACEYRLKHKDGSWRTVLARAQALRDKTGKPYRMAGSVADVTAQRAVEKQLVQAQKMEAVGQLTGGLAHDFNNRLAAIVTCLELLEDEVADNAAARDLIASALRSADRGTDLTRRLLVFSRSNELRPTSVDVNRTIMDMSELLRRTLRESIAVETIAADRLWAANVDPGQLENAILNLALNARDAMPEGGKLTLETANVELDQDYVAQHADVRVGQYVMLAVTDTGMGMTPEVLSHAFEPFFTTKGMGRGSGLGLSMIYGFVTGSGGHVKIYSEPGIGTTVKMFLPRALQVEAAVPAQPLPARERKGVETILVVEDDGEVCDKVEKLLRSLGYGVLVAQDGPSALAALQSPTPIDLLLTDVGLPHGMNGAELARLARERLPDLGIVFMSGYTQGAFRANGLLEEGAELLSKPFRRSDLERAIRRVLGRHQGPAYARDTAASSSAFRNGL